MDLLKIRDQIDVIDEKILGLFEKRMDLCRQVAEFKIQTGKKVFDKEREAAKLAALGEKASSQLSKQGVQEVFRQIMSVSRKLQYELLSEHGMEEAEGFAMVEELPKNHVRVVFQGVEGAYSFAAMNTYFGGCQIESFHVKQWRDAMEILREGKADYAVLPIENSTAGIVQDMYDLLAEYDNHIAGEQIIPCEHTLLGVPGATLEQIRTVYSHPQALMQCKSFLEEHPGWKQEQWLNTADAARKVAQDKDVTQAAIASAHAAKFYGLTVLAKDIYTETNNSTRFIIVTNRKIYTKEAGKISICFELPHESGSLYNSLSHFIYNNLNMTKIESRPIPGKNWEYRFFLDFEGNLHDSAVKNALRGLAQESSAFRILGNY